MRKTLSAIALVASFGIAGQALATGTDGCTPGKWKQEFNFDLWPTASTTTMCGTNAISPSADFEDIFCVDVGGPFKSVNFPPNREIDATPAGKGGSSITLLEALSIKGGGEGALMRHAVAALLNSKSPGIDFEWNNPANEAVVWLVQCAYDQEDPALKPSPSNVCGSNLPSLGTVSPALSGFGDYEGIFVTANERDCPLPSTPQD